jgi:hypothetical protein
MPLSDAEHVKGKEGLGYFIFVICLVLKLFFLLASWVILLSLLIILIWVVFKALID